MNFKVGDLVVSSEEQDDSIYQIEIVNHIEQQYYMRRISSNNFENNRSGFVSFERVHRLCTHYRVRNNKLSRGYYKRFKEDGEWLIPITR